MQQINYITKHVCYHCGEDCKGESIHVEEKEFCCEGCKLVYEILKENNLCKYYDFTENPGIHAKGKFVSEKYSYLDDSKVISKLLSFNDGEQSRVVFYIPQMHCSSCIWLLENLHKINPSIIKSQVDFSKKEINILFNNSISLRKVVELLSFVGYEPLITLNDLDKKQSSKINKAQFLKMGIAGFCFGNIMMLSFPEYFSDGQHLDKGLKTFFSYLNLFISLPVFFYSASDFFVSAYKGFLQKFINIDAPIALAVLITFVRSVYEILSGSGAGYLDSMSGIVFFMLIGRYFQSYTYDTLSFSRDYKSYFPIAVALLKDGIEVMVPVSDLKIGDRVKIKNNELVPVDGIVFGGDANIDYSFVTGESNLVNKVLGEIIYAGGKQVGASIELEVLKEVGQSYLTQLWNNEAFKKSKDDKNSYIHIVSKYFSLFLLTLATGAFIYWLPVDLHRALNALTAVLIVACPCALLLSATFTNGNLLRVYGKNKLYLKNATIIEKMAQADTIVFDKTGTITQYNQSNVFYEGADLSEDALSIIRSLASQSSHPLSKNILLSLSAYNTLPVKDYKEYSGRGIEGYVNGTHIKMGSKEFVTNNSESDSHTYSNVYVMLNKIVYGKFMLKNKYREGLKPLINSFENKYSMVVLSGDNDAEAGALKDIFNNKAQLRFNQSPADKLNFIKSLQEQNHKVIMVGDGLNDAGALMQSDVGIAISDNINNFSPACDAILDASKFDKLKVFIDYAKAGQMIIVASFIISLMYNIVGLWYSVSGNLSPVIAAILMPISSITIILFTVGCSNITAMRKLSGAN